MDFFYPNFTNDMWRIFGLCFHGNKLHFVDELRKTFKQNEIEQLLIQKSIGIFDTARKVIRSKNTASDKDLEVVEATNISLLLDSVPQCKALVTTGQKATDIVCNLFGIRQPEVGKFASFEFQTRKLMLFRMPSSSRAYPLKVEKKAEVYLSMFQQLGIISSESSSIIK